MKAWTLLMVAVGGIPMSCTPSAPSSESRAPSPEVSVEQSLEEPIWDVRGTEVFTSEDRWALSVSGRPRRPCLEIVFRYERDASGRYCSGPPNRGVVAQETWEGYKLDNEFFVYGIINNEVETITLLLGRRTVELEPLRYGGVTFFAQRVVAKRWSDRSFLVVSNANGRDESSVQLCDRRWWRNQGSSCAVRLRS